MAKQKGVSLPSGQGGLIGGFSSSQKTKYEFGPKVVIYFSLAVVFFVWLLNYTLK
jgi:preprotein translocase subunit Sec61beta